MIDQSEVEAIRSALTTELSRLQTYRNELKSKIEVDPDSLMDQFDISADEHRMLVTTNVADLQAQRTLEISKALHRIKNGHYGRCTVCDEMIETARLKAVPTTSICVDCCDNVFVYRTLHRKQYADSMEDLKTAFSDNKLFN